MAVDGPIEDREELYRRVAPEYYAPGDSQHPIPEAFKPHKVRDANGLSLARAELVSVEDAQRTEVNPKVFRHLAALCAGDLRNNLGLLIEPNPNKPGYALITNLNAMNRDSDEAAEWYVRMANEFTIRVIPPPPGGANFAMSNDGDPEKPAT